MGLSPNTNAMPQITKNKQALFNYQIQDQWEAGIVLSGPEVKSVKNRGINLKGAYANIINNQAWLINCHIAPYKPAALYQKNYDPTRRRKLLLNKKEINEINGKLSQKGLTLLPLRVYNKGGLIKVEIGLGQGRKKHDKRELLKKRDDKRRINLALKR